MTTEKLCRVCAVTLKEKWDRRWVAIGTCPACGEQHVLFEVVPDEPHVDAEEFETPEHDIHRQNPDNQARQVEGLCGYYERQS